MTVGKYASGYGSSEKLAGPLRYVKHLLGKEGRISKLAGMTDRARGRMTLSRGSHWDAEFGFPAERNGVSWWNDNAGCYSFVPSLGRPPNPAVT